MRLNTSCLITKNFAIKMGYTLLIVDGLARASNHVDYAFPQFGLINGHNSETLFAQGLSLGFEFNR